MQHAIPVMPSEAVRISHQETSTKCNRPVEVVDIGVVVVATVVVVVVVAIVVAVVAAAVVATGCGGSVTSSLRQCV